MQKGVVKTSGKKTLPLSWHSNTSCAKTRSHVTSAFLRDKKGLLLSYSRAQYEVQKTKVFQHLILAFHGSA
jgi:hypothetical protein